MNYEAPACCSDSGAYTGIPDVRPYEKSLNIPEIIEKLDGLLSRGLQRQAGEFLNEKLKEAEKFGDWRSELSILSEVMGFSRRSKDEAAGLEAVNRGLSIIDDHGLSETVSGATVILNAATTLECFGQTERSLTLFAHVSRVFSENLLPGDYRLAGLYNNMALPLCAAGRFDEAEKYFKLALKVLCASGENYNEIADTLCNLAEMYDKIDPDDCRIDRCMEKAWEYLNSPGIRHDSYHAFTLEKCIPCFDHFGYFLWAKALRERVNTIYERT